ncbi:MAG: histidine kinase [Bacteroidales bacterium]|nr:histidine kinase [Bacteroidales bacterium]
MFNPVFKKIKYFLYYISLWIIISMIHFSILKFFGKYSTITSLIDSIVYNIIFAIISIGLWYVVFYNSIEKKSYFNIILTHFIAAFITISFWIISGNFITSEILNSFSSNHDISLNNTISLRIISGIMFYLVTIFAYYLNIYYSNFKEKIINEAKLESLIKEAELKAIKSQINPHFLFNSLNSISLQTIKNPSKAQEMIINLSEYLRYSISQKDKQTSWLKEEIENCKKYLEIEKSRFGDKLETEFIIDEKCYDFYVPTMILQPLYENAIKHGVYESSDIVKIKTKIKHFDAFIEIEIINNFDPEAIIKKGEGFGLKSVRDRLILIYENENLFSIKKNKNTFTVKLIIPKK